MKNSVPVPGSLRLSFAAGVVPLLALVLLGSGTARLSAAPSNSVSDAGLGAFSDVVSVVRSPRCMNCHPAGDVPRQTDQRTPHFPPVSRGADGHGLTGMRCSACHQAANQSNGVPGAPNWGLAPRSMAWVGLTDHELAEQMKDPKRNGHRTLEQMLEHISNERLVLWAWQPGGGRTLPPLSHDKFVQRFKDWIAAGAPTPNP